MMAHTPGPWGFNKYSGIGAGRFNLNPYVMSGGAVMGSYAHGNKGDLTAEENRANANLIAAAPELLEALKTLRDVFEDIVGFTSEFGARIDSVIAKAEGR